MHIHTILTYTYIHAYRCIYIYIHRYTYNTDIYMHTYTYIQYKQIHTYTYNMYIYLPYVHIHTIDAYTYNTYIHTYNIYIDNTYIYRWCKQHMYMILTYTYIYLHIHTYTCKYNLSTYMHVFCKDSTKIHANTYRYLQYEHQKEILSFWILKKVYVFGMYSHVFVRICVRIWFLYASIVSICRYQWD